MNEARAMTRRNDPSPLPDPVPEGSARNRGEGAFELWLQRELHRLFDGVAREPIPPELLRLIEQDRQDHGAPPAQARPDGPEGNGTG
jgi:hypothetical protein